MERRHSLIKLRVPVLDWQLHFLGLLRVPESSTCDSDLSIPVETGRPPFPANVEKGFWLRSRFAPRLDVHTTVRLASRSSQPCQNTFLNILKDLRLGPSWTAILNNLPQSGRLFRQAQLP